MNPETLRIKIYPQLWLGIFSLPLCPFKIYSFFQVGQALKIIYFHSFFLEEKFREATCPTHCLTVWWLCSAEVAENGFSVSRAFSNILHSRLRPGSPELPIQCPVPTSVGSSQGDVPRGPRGRSKLCALRD